MSSPDVDSIIKSELKTALAAAIPDWPIRWANEQWPPGTRMSTTAGNLPVDPDGLPLPCLQARIQLGDDMIALGPEDNRVSRQLALLKIYFMYPQGWGDDQLTRKIGDLRRAFNQKTILLDSPQWQRLSLDRIRGGSNEAASEDGARYVYTVTFPVWFYYRS